jgi:anaerobic magnesium-protoporphyrin IX monomethyl ester cyclase
MKVFFVSLPDPPGIHVFRFHSAGFGSSFVMPHPEHRYDVYPPIYEAYAAAILEKGGHNIRILDCQSPNLSLEQIAEEIRKFDPEIIVSRICLPSYAHDLKMMAQLKERFREVFMVGWGGTCKVFPEDVLEKGHLDLVIREVELECALPDLVIKFEKRSLNQVLGASFRSESGIVHNSDRPFNKNLDVIPLPAYHLLEMSKYVAPENHYVSGGSKDKFVPFFSVSGSRGCSFNCLYCPYPVTYGPWRGRAPEKIVDEIEVLVSKYGIRTIWFHDQTFSMIPQRTAKLCDEIIDRKLDIKWATETRVDRLDEPLLKKMKRSGCSRLEVGVETGDPQLLATVGKRGLTVERIIEITDAIRREGIIVETNFLVGLPGHSWESIKKTSELIKKINPDILTAMIVTPYPGTPLYKMAEENKWLLTKDWSKYTLFNPVFSMPGFSDKDMKEAHSFLYRQYAINKEKADITEAFRKRDLKTLTKKLVSDIPKFFAQIPKVIKSRFR